MAGWSDEIQLTQGCDAWFVAAAILNAVRGHRLWYGLRWTGSSLVLLPAGLSGSETLQSAGKAEVLTGPAERFARWRLLMAR